MDDTLGRKEIHTLNQMDWKSFFKPKTSQTPPQTPKKPSTIPMLDQVMSATKGATDGISSVSKQVNTSFRMLGASSIQGMVGYGVGFHHGFGFGLSMRSGVTKLKSNLVESMTKMSGLIPGLPFGKGASPTPAASKSAMSKVPTDQVSAESMMQLANKSADQISAGSMMQQATKSFNQISQESMMQLATKSVNQLSQDLVGSQPTNIGSAFDNKVSNRVAVDSASDIQTEKAELMKPEDNLLQTVMKQRQLIDELSEENTKLCQILQLKDLQIPSNKLQPSSSDPNLQTLPSSEVNDKITGDSIPPCDTDGTLPTSKGENGRKDKS
ncbi:unnamed protein product [Sphenostylis stenocarpa]|uniref:Uncharacterized protein n=1 Tax=Sphenostylis stenocarpa TaxID=92480 RepID=A0AA86V8F3_9FABA|nr:unnamed protein product [Sphenostylis stenocarpa]